MNLDMWSSGYLVIALVIALIIEMTQ